MRWWRLVAAASVCLSAGCESHVSDSRDASQPGSSPSALSIDDSGLKISAAVWPAGGPHEFGGGGLRAELVVIDGCLALKSGSATRRVAVPSTMRLAKSESGVVVEAVAPNPLLATVRLGAVLVFGVMDAPPTGAQSRKRLIAVVGGCGPEETLWYWSGSTSKE